MKERVYIDILKFTKCCAYSEKFEKNGLEDVSTLSPEKLNFFDAFPEGQVGFFICLFEMFTE